MDKLTETIVIKCTPALKLAITAIAETNGTLPSTEGRHILTNHVEKVIHDTTLLHEAFSDYRNLVNHSNPNNSEDK